MPWLNINTNSNLFILWPLLFYIIAFLFITHPITTQSTCLHSYLAPFLVGKNSRLSSDERIKQSHQTMQVSVGSLIHLDAYQLTTYISDWYGDIKLEMQFFLERNHQCIRQLFGKKILDCKNRQQCSYYGSKSASFNSIQDATIGFLLWSSCLTSSLLVNMFWLSHNYCTSLYAHFLLLGIQIE